ncbi:MAG: outer membrane lipoprotein [Gammaproteobacteria bacterium]|jgi:outer membrane lipoprotein
MLIFLLSACSSNIPLEIREAPANAPTLPEVRDRPNGYVSQSVRWGGRILETTNGQNSSQITIVAFPLSDEGRPRTDEASSGRFIASINHFLEPLEYKSDRLITVTGTYSRTETLVVGEYRYEYPVVDIAHSYIWPVIVRPVYNPYPHYWHHNPWYDRRYFRPRPAITEIIKN